MQERVKIGCSLFQGLKGFRRDLLNSQEKVKESVQGVLRADCEARGLFLFLIGGILRSTRALKVVFEGPLSHLGAKLV